MNARTRFATLLLAWLVIIPIAVLAPGQTADAAPEEDTALATLAATPDIEFGTRLSGGQAANAHVAAAGFLSTSSPMLGGFTLWKLDKPDFSIWPNERLNQVINLDSFMSITDGWVGESWCILPGPWGCIIWADTIPVGARFEFRELGTGGRDTEDCWGPGIPWFWGQTDASGPFHCGQEWLHSSDITGQVEVKARSLQWLFLNGIGPIPVKSRASEAKTLDVGEVLNIGQTIALPVVDIPEVTAESGFCSVWGVSFVCWLGEEAAELALKAIYAVMPFLEEVAAFFEGCADAVIDAAGGLVNIIRELKDLITNPGEFVSEKLQEFRDLIEAIREDPEAFVTEALSDILELDKLKEEGGANWVGTLVCKLAIEYFTGKAADTIISSARKWLRDRRDGPDVPNPNCLLSSFPGDTQVLMADGDYERIDSIRPGDVVLSHNVDTSVWEPGLVVDQWSHLDRGPPATATLASTATITATDDHLFWRSNTSEWVELQYLNSGDQLLTPAGVTTVDQVIVGDRQDWTVWELTVLDNHNFTVLAGDDPVLVHNGRRCPGKSEDIQNTNHPDGAATAAEQASWDRYLDRMDTEGTVPLTADEWLARKRDLDRARGAGTAFERDALGSPDVDLPKNTTQLGSDPGFIPDGIKNAPAPPARAEFGDPLDFVEMKNVEYLSDTGNVSAMIDHVDEFGGSMDLIVGPQTRISGPLRQRLEDIGARVGIYENGRVRYVDPSEIPTGPAPGN